MEIASASGEQARGIEQVTGGVGQLDKVTQATAGNSEELAAASEETASQASSLMQLVQQFKVQEKSLARESGKTEGVKDKIDGGSAGSGSKKAGSSSTASTRSMVSAVRVKDSKREAPALATKTMALTTSAKSASQSEAERIIPMNDDDQLASF
jgi:hypothetical protein